MGRKFAFRNLGILWFANILFLLASFTYAQEKENFLLRAIRSLSVSVGGEGYLQVSQPDIDEFGEHSYYYKIYLQTESPLGFKIRWSHLDTHYRFWRYHNNQNSQKLDKIQLELNRKLTNSIDLKVGAGHLDDFTFAQGLTFDSQYTFGYMFQICTGKFSFESSYLHSDVHLDAFWLNRINLFDRFGISIIFIDDLMDYFHYMPGLDFSIPLFHSKLKLIGEIRQNKIDTSHEHYVSDSEFTEELAYLGGLKFCLNREDKDLLSIQLLLRKYGKYFNNNYSYTSHFTSIQYRSPEVLHRRYDNWQHYLFLPGTSRGISGSIIFQKYIFNNFRINGDFEYIEHHWIDESYKIEKSLFNFSFFYIYDQMIYLELGIRNKVLNNRNILYNNEQGMRYDDYAWSSPLFIQTDNLIYYFRIGFNF